MNDPLNLEAAARELHAENRTTPLAVIRQAMELGARLATEKALRDVQRERAGLEAQRRKANAPQ